MQGTFNPEHRCAETQYHGGWGRNTEEGVGWELLAKETKDGGAGLHRRQCTGPSYLLNK